MRLRQELNYRRCGMILKICIIIIQLYDIPFIIASAGFTNVIDHTLRRKFRNDI
eukprot:UN16859